MIYNKLVRDKIPEIIEQSGKKAKIRIVQGEELKRALKNKLVEEARELLHANTEEEVIEELADVFEVLDSIVLNCLDISGESRIYKKAKEKYMAKGGFEKGYFLESVEEGENGKEEKETAHN